MSYVGTPSYLGDPQSTLASILQGEAGNQGLVGMQAVGGVISNRAALNFSGYGSDPLSQALAPNQFQGQNTAFSPDAYSVAGDILNGTNPDPTGGATFYANPSASTANWATNLNSSNALQIGAHFFTNNTSGIPFFGSQTANTGTTDVSNTLDYPYIGNSEGGNAAPTLAGTPETIQSNLTTSADNTALMSYNVGSTDPTTFNIVGAGAVNQNLGAASDVPATSNPGLGAATSTDNGINYYDTSVNAGSTVGNVPAGTDAFAPGTALNGDDDFAGYSPTQDNGGLGSTGTSVDSTLMQSIGPTDTTSTIDTGVAPDASGTTPSVNPTATTLVKAINQQTKGNASDTAASTKATLAAATSTNQATIAAANATDQTNTTLFGSLEAYTSNLFIRGAFIVLGLIMIAAGLWMLAPREVKDVAAVAAI